MSGRYIYFDLVAFVVAILVVGLPCPAKYSGGMGEPNNPYLIATAEDMNEIGADSNDWDKHFLLVADINLADYTGTQFNIIGYYIDYYNNKPFTGVFDGNSHTISDFTYTTTHTDCIGLFGYVDDPNAEIKDLSLIDPNVNIDSKDLVFDVGCLVGRLVSGRIIGCGVEGASVSGTSCLGGLVGGNGGEILYSSAAGLVECAKWSGGLVGENHGTISNCYSRANIYGHRSIGGLTSYNSGEVSRCYSTGKVEDTSFGWRCGGLIGENEGIVTACFWEFGAGYDNNVGKKITTTEMQLRSTFEEAGWDFNDVWDICEGTNYPRLQWAIPAADFVCPDGVNFLDYSYWAGWWLSSCDAGNDYCSGADFNQSGIVDEEDLAVLCRWWLQGI